MSSTEVERNGIELMKVRDGMMEIARESEATEASEIEKTLPDCEHTENERQRDGKYTSQRNQNCLGQTDGEPSTTAVGKQYCCE